MSIQVFIGGRGNGQRREVESRCEVYLLDVTAPPSIFDGPQVIDNEGESTRTNTLEPYKRWGTSDRHSNYVSFFYHAETITPIEAIKLLLAGYKP